MAEKTESCIYCGADVDASRGEGDHIIPENWGNFRNDIRFHRICTGCHSEIDKSTEQLVRCGPEAVIVEQMGGRSRRSRRGWRSAKKGSHGASAPKPLVPVEDRWVTVETTALPGTVALVDQVVVGDEEGNVQRVRLYPQMSADQLLHRIDKGCRGKVLEIFVTCSEEHWTRYLDLLRTRWPNMKVEDLPSTEGGMRGVLGRLLFEVGERYFRAIVKMAFHYLLTHSRRSLVGNEPIFDDVRKFIASGGEVNRFLAAAPKQQSNANIPSGRSTGVYHRLVADESRLHGDWITVDLDLFAGTGLLVPPVYRVRLARFDRQRVLVPDYVWGHRYLYGRDEQGRGSLGGWVEQLSIARLPSRLWVPRR